MRVLKEDTVSRLRGFMDHEAAPASWSSDVRLRSMFIWCVD